MRRSRTLCRLLADALAHLMVRSLPSGRQIWGEAMTAEVRSIDRDAEALRWAAGCLCAALLVQWRETALLNHGWVRWGIAAWAGYQAQDSLGTSLAVLSYKQPGLGLASALPYWCAAGDYRLLSPIFDTVSDWEISIGVAAALLYLFAGVQLLRRFFYQARALAGALAVCLGLWLYELSKPVYFHSFPLRDHVQDGLVYAATALLVWVVCAGAPSSMTGRRG